MNKWMWVVAAAALWVQGQTTEFEVVEVRVVQAGPRRSENEYTTNRAGQLVQIRMEGGSAHAVPVFGPNGQVTMREATMRQLIEAAYHLVWHEDLSGPGWIDSDRFDLIAKAPAGASVEDERVMLQRVLAERFHLETHWAQASRRVYALVAGKGVAKMREAVSREGEGCRRQEAAGDDVKFACHLTMTAFAEWLPRLASTQVDRPVVDVTGLAAAYDFEIRWTPIAPGADAFGGTTIFTAIDRQLGLKLEERRLPVRTLTIDRVDRAPTAP